MDRSLLLLDIVNRLHGAGFKRTAAWLGGALSQGRNCSVDADGDWIIVHDGGPSFANTRPHLIRYDLVRAFTADEWLHVYQPSQSDVMVDAGAGIGEEAVVFSPLVGRILSIEAHPDIYRCLTKTVDKSRLANVEPIHCALSDEDGGTVQISDNPEHVANTILGGEGVHTVPTRTIQSLCRERGIARIDFLKMNIEGAEALALSGLGDIPVGTMAIACHDFIGPEYATRDAVRSFMERRGLAVTRRSDHPSQDTLHAA